MCLMCFLVIRSPQLFKQSPNAAPRNRRLSNSLLKPMAQTSSWVCWARRANRTDKRTWLLACSINLESLYTPSFPKKSFVSRCLDLPDTRQGLQEVVWRILENMTFSLAVSMEYLYVCRYRLTTFVGPLCWRFTPPYVGSYGSIL